MHSLVTCRRYSLDFSRFILFHFQDFLQQYHTSPSKNPSLVSNSKNPITVFPQNCVNSPSKSNLSSNSARRIPSSNGNDILDFNSATVLETLSSYSNDWKQALEFFNWVEFSCGFQHTTETYNRVIDILGKYFEFDAAWDLIRKMRKSSSFARPDHTTFRIMFKRYVSAHLVKEAFDTFDQMEEFNLRDDVSFSNLIDALCEHKHVIEAEELCFGSNSNGGKHLFCSLNVKIYNMILRGWFKMGWWRKCREFWEEMDKRGIKKDLYSYSIYMDIQCKSGKAYRAVNLYKEMKKKGIKLDVVAYNTVIRAIGISDGVDVALKLYREMVELGCQPNVATYNSILKLMCENGRNKEALEMLNEMFKKGYKPNVLTYHCFFGSLQKPKMILNLFDRMIENGVRPRMDTYVMLMRKFGRWGFLRPVFLIWEKIEEHGLSPDEFAYNALIDALVQKGMVDMARKYDEEMIAKGLSAKPREELGGKLVSVASEDG
ncbi:hypothetical protein M9H77_29238 [Catharanthus roseus]|uniref:Uncharacterized protein n=1 Tax=Catharanthus roseus TaxID=4058 RepID=A0ACC0AHW1_CATRO|nr:hypothetical protein M9H77_29238 [Catharanthus roseus]